MKTKNKEKRVINIPKEQFDKLKEYCERNSLDMVSWIIKNSTEKTITPIPSGMISSSQAREIADIARSPISVPPNWISIIMKSIEEDIKYQIQKSDPKNEIYFKPIIPLENVYGRAVELDLTDSQISTLKDELKKYGYVLDKNPTGYTKSCSYKITW